MRGPSGGAPSVRLCAHRLRSKNRPRLGLVVLRWSRCSYRFRFEGRVACVGLSAHFPFGRGCRAPRFGNLGHISAVRGRKGPRYHFAHAYRRRRRGQYVRRPGRNFGVTPRKMGRSAEGHPPPALQNRLLLFLLLCRVSKLFGWPFGRLVYFEVSEGRRFTPNKPNSSYYGRCARGRCGFATRLLNGADVSP